MVDFTVIGEDCDQSARMETERDELTYKTTSKAFCSAFKIYSILSKDTTPRMETERARDELTYKTTSKASCSAFTIDFIVVGPGAVLETTPGPKIYVDTARPKVEQNCR
uniref:Uncharacterized protein n=1 Tax=Mesocestoides corti TaxID=53468 RepID=A0A5K3EZW7_MESCO